MIFNICIASARISCKFLSTVASKLFLLYRLFSCKNLHIINENKYHCVHAECKTVLHCAYFLQPFIPKDQKGRMADSEGDFSQDLARSEACFNIQCGYRQCRYCRYIYSVDTVDIHTDRRHGIFQHLV